MSKRSKAEAGSSSEEEVDLFISDHEDSDVEPDEYDLHATNAIIKNEVSEFNICKKLESLTRNKREVAVKKLESMLKNYDNDALYHLVTVLLLEYYYTGWSVGDKAASLVDSLFEDKYGDWDDPDYWNMVDKCKLHVTETLTSEESTLQVSSNLLYEAYFGDGGCVFSQTYEYINEFLSKLS